MVWQLSLDQIEGNTGRIVDKKFCVFSNAGSSTFCFDTGNVLYSKLRPYLNKVAIPDEPGIATTELIPLRPDTKVLNASYLAYYLRSQNFTNQASHHVAGAKMPRVVMDWFWQHEIPLPPLSEQRRIVEILDEADRIQKLRREADQKAERILPALFLKMFGDPATNPKGWDINTISKVVMSTDYGTSKKASGVSGLPLIRMGNVDYSGHMDLTDLKYVHLEPSAVTRLRLEAGDILFNRTNSKELVGKTGLWDGTFEAVAASYFIRVRVNHNRVTPCFFWAFMNSEYMKRKLLSTARGAIGQANINSTELKSLPIVTPPIDLQHLFSKRWESIKLSVSQQRRETTILEKVFSNLLERAFSGQLTAHWSKTHMKELLNEMEQQARLLNLPLLKMLETV
jgi:type I restriction enzyme S subunit